MSQWMVSLDKLIEEQKYIINNEIPKNKNQWIRGFAGSGKSVLLVHGIYDLIYKNPNIRICVIVFTNSLKQLFMAGFKELKITDKNVYICTYHQFRRDNYTFDYIFCDEVQDLPKSILEKMKANAKYVISAGDENQSIYDTDPQPPHEPVVNSSEIGSILNANTLTLNTNLRLTRSLIELVSSFLPSIKDILYSKIDQTKKDVTPNLAKGSSKEKEVEYIISNAQTKLGIGENAVIILPGHDSVVEFINTALRQANKNTWDPEDSSNQNKWGKVDFGSLNRHLKNNNINIEYIGNNYGDLYNNGNTDKIIVMTYHSSKGLDFDNVYLPFMGTHYDKSMYYFNDTLFMVGMTRSKLALTITYSGSMNDFTDRIENKCNKIDIDNIMSQSSSNFDDDFDF